MDAELIIRKALDRIRAREMTAVYEGRITQDQADRRIKTAWSLAAYLLPKTNIGVPNQKENKS